jgi:hypothetical protein
MAIGNRVEDIQGISDVSAHARHDLRSKLVLVRRARDEVIERVTETATECLGGDRPGIGVGQGEVGDTTVDPDNRHRLHNPEAEEVFEDNHVTRNEVVAPGGVLVHEDLIDARRIGQPTRHYAWTVDVA